MGDENGNSAVTFRDAQFLDNRIVEVKRDVLTEMRDMESRIEATLKTIDDRVFNLNREVGGLKGRMQVISGIVGATSGLIAALTTKIAAPHIGTALISLLGLN